MQNLWNYIDREKWNIHYTTRSKQTGLGLNSVGEFQVFLCVFNGLNSDQTLIVLFNYSLPCHHQQFRYILCVYIIHFRVVRKLWTGTEMEKEGNPTLIWETLPVYVLRFEKGYAKCKAGNKIFIQKFYSEKCYGKRPLLNSTWK